VLVLVDRASLDPGEEALAQLRVDAATPLAALPGDRFIARGFVVQERYGTTLGGGEVLRVEAPKARKASDAAALLRRIEAADRDDRIALEVRSSGVAGIDALGLGRKLGLPVAELAAALDRLVLRGELLRVTSPSGSPTSASGSAAALAVGHIHAEHVAALEKRLLDTVDAFQAASPHREGMSREELRARLPPALPVRAYELLVASLSARGTLELAGDLVRRTRAAGPNIGLTPLEATIAERFRAWATEPPRPTEVAAALPADPAAVRTALDRLLATKALVKVKPDFYIDAETLSTLRTRLTEHLQAHGQITPQEWKEIVGTSRRYSIPLAEHFDAEKLTLRVGDIRRKR
jgi:selenocysteine-specific elongation factor